MVKGFENIIVLDKLSFSNYITADIRKNSMTEHKKYPLKKLLLSCGIILFLAGFCGVEAYMHLARSYDYHVVTRCIANLKLNGILCYMYAEENNGKFPDTPDYIRQNSGYMKCLKDPDQEGDSYFLIPGLTKNNSAEMPLMIEKPIDHKDKSTIIILHVGGHVTVMKKTVRSYTELLPVFPGLTPPEKEYLQQIFREWDGGNFSFFPESPFLIAPSTGKP